MLSMSRIEEKFGQQVRKLRLDQHISQEELGFRSNLSKNYISDVESGTRNVSLQAIEKISKGLNVEIYQLFDWR